MHELMEASEAIRRRVVAHGQVQGVFFRAASRSGPTPTGVAGWARNRADGSMEACFEGPEARSRRWSPGAPTAPRRPGSTAST